MKAISEHIPKGFVSAPCGVLDMAGNEKAAIVTKIVLFTARFDISHMHRTYYQLLRAWPFLAGRLRKGTGELRELWSVHIPTAEKLEDLIRADIPANYVSSKVATPMFSSTDRPNESITDIIPFARFAQDPTKLSQEDPTIATIDRLALLEDFTSPYGLKTNEEYFVREAALFTVHVTNFADGAGFTFTVPHASFDGAGAKVVLDAYLGLLRGEAIESMAPIGYDPFMRFAPKPTSPAATSVKSDAGAKRSSRLSIITKRDKRAASSASSEPPQPAQWRILSILSLLVLCYYIGKDYIFDRPERKMKRVMIFVPPKFIESLKQQVQRDVKAEHGAERLEELRLSRANALHAWVLQNELARRVDVKPDRMTAHGTLANMRFRLPAGLPAIHPTYTGNCLVPIVTPLTTTRKLASSSLGALAYDVRSSLLEQSTPEEMEHYVRWQTWRGTPAAQGGGLQKTGMAVFFPPNARFTLVTDWTKFGLWDLDWSGALPTHSSFSPGKSLDSPSSTELPPTPTTLVEDQRPAKEGSDSSSTITAADKCGMIAIIGDAHVPLHHRSSWILVGGRNGACWILGTISEEERRHPRGWGRYGSASPTDFP
ncbi:unnamed protein product [Tilletia controversa]|uniref:Uncharacterized protein n=1 Tax=Tilletia controversa TaxID=13291 RepID=A0A8X7MKI4_9BASI|nr:hypothetical protein CF328_g7663 [Tilletia controversa]KAE8239307.1 hypothetical protein A4X06_0g8361 [Tilletia controversa]CAD6900729.1 unnamed protein product [Tilletia controversa]CAD6900925.1 unnamed protein product [Tilletia controversa]CAD6940982.1 unnamed protein product [Tilletia controversa]